MKNETIKIHFFYVTLILVLSIVILISIKFGHDSDLINYISFAGTISSILLAIAAIIYSYYSNNSFSQNIGSLDVSSEKISNSAEKLIEIIDKVDKKIDNLPDQFKHVEEKTNRTYDMLEKLVNTRELVAQDKKSTITKMSDELLNNFLAGSSFSGLKLIYACALSKQNNKSFHEDITLVDGDEGSAAQYDYNYGYRMAIDAFGILKIVNKDRTITVNYIDQYILDNIKKHIYEKANTNDSTTKIPDDLWISDIKKIENYFND